MASESSVHTLRRRRLRFVLLGAALLSSACFDDCPWGPSDDECGKENTQRFESTAPFAFPLPHTSFRDGGAVTFAWDFDVSGLCVAAGHSSEAGFGVSTNLAEPEPTGLAMEGRIYHTAFIQPYKTTIHRGEPGIGDNRWFGLLDGFGLEQGNPNSNSATVGAELAITFVSSGNIDNDRVAASRYITKVDMYVKYRHPK